MGAFLGPSRYAPTDLAALIVYRQDAYMSEIEIAVLDLDAATDAVPALADVLADCVNGGASVNFMLPYSGADAADFFRKVIPSVAAGETILLAARVDGQIVGTVQLGMDTPPNQPHRGEIKKLLVHRSARGKGVGAALMTRIEGIAKEKGRTLLILDTASDDARRLYERGGWRKLGNIPDYALWPAGGFCDTTIYWKKL
jgi:GNAT superfamily N-acetyltransferase